MQSEINNKHVGLEERQQVDGEDAGGIVPPLSNIKAQKMVRDLKAMIANHRFAIEGLQHIVELYEQKKPILKRISKREEQIQKITQHYSKKFNIKP